MLFVAAIMFRVILIFSVPNLSQDFYRFIWDGRLMMYGYNPYLHLPADLISTPGFNMPQAQLLYEGMGSLSAAHHSNYPPLHQLCFIIAASVAGKSIAGSLIVFKLLIIAADTGIFFAGKKLLRALQLPGRNIFIYLLNPLVIIELTGNLHFEAVMIFFFVAGLYFLQKRQFVRSALMIAFSITVKLVPLMLLPLFIRHLSFKRSLFFYSIIFLVIILLSLPFFSASLISNYTSSVSLWFVNFEFNGSIYNLIRYIGYNIKGYNIIGTVGQVMPFILITFILLFAARKSNNKLKSLMANMLLALSVYFFLSTTIHPWYITMLVAVSVFTGYKFPVVWSAVVVLSYIAYAGNIYKENSVMLLIEYSVVYTCFFMEFYRQAKLEHDVPL